MHMFEATHTGKALHGEHHSTMQTMNDLEALIQAKAPPNAADPTIRARLESTAQVLEDDVTNHFQFEEDHLFPTLEQAGAGFMVSMLKGEHEIIRPLAASIRLAALRAVSDGAFTEAAWQEFRRTATELVEREIFHIQKEEMGLLAALAQILSPEQDRDLAALHDRLRE